MFKLRKPVFALAILSPLVFATPAWAGGVSFTADAVQTYPNGGAQRGKIFVADEGIRFELITGARRVVQIVLPAKKVTQVLFPDDKVFIEYPGAATLPTDRPSTPCQQSQGLKCEKIGTDKLGDSEAEKWKMAPEGAPSAILMWWDPIRKMMLRQELPDGRVIQMTKMGSEDYQGRTVERWDTRYMMPSGQMFSTVQLFDAKLGITVREARPDGVMRLLRDIREVEADPAWFQIPEDYRKVEPTQKGSPADAQEKPQR